MRYFLSALIFVRCRILERIYRISVSVCISTSGLYKYEVWVWNGGSAGWHQAASENGYKTYLHALVCAYDKAKYFIDTAPDIKSKIKSL